MEVNFTVSGSTERELVDQAQETLKSFTDPKDWVEWDRAALSRAITVRPLIQAAGSSVPAMWEGEVRIYT